MKTLYESILDDNIGDNSIVQMFFKSLINAKSFKEFKDVALSLKSYLDDEVGDDYNEAHKKTKQNRSGYYLAIEDLGIPLNEELCKIVVSSGLSNVYYLRFYKSTGRVNVRKTNMSFYDLNIEGNCVYVLNDKWNELRKMIINKN